MIHKSVSEKFEQTLMRFIPLPDDPEMMRKGFLTTYGPAANGEAQNGVEELFGFGSGKRTEIWSL